MFRNIVNAVVFVAGLAAVLWIGAGYLGTNLLGVAVTAVIAACYLAGALELLRYRQASAQLAQALASTATAGSAGLEPWLQGLPAALRPSVRLRIEGERAALPAPVLAPYLVGLLVLLGMLGTLLGMMATLRGTGIALESASDLDAIRGSLGAPVKGLAFAFGTSIAGVASSAMLGLLASLCRRERMQLVQQLDRQIAGELRLYTRAHQREQSLHLLQQQAAAMPALVDRLQAMITAIDQHSGQLNAQLLERQQQFHERSEAGHRQLAVAIEQSLQSSVAASAQAVSQALQPLVHDTMATIAGQTTALHDALGAAVQRQLDGVQAGVERSTVAAGDSWKAALAGQQQANQTLTSALHGALDTFNQRFEQRSGHLLETLAGSLSAASASTAASWEQALARQQALNDELSQHHQQALAGAATTLEQHSATLLAQLQQRQHEQQARNDELGQRQQQAWARAAEAVHGQSTAMLAQWQQSQAAQQALNAELSQHQQQALLAATAALDTQSTALIAQLRQTHSEQQALNAELSQHQQQAWVAATSTLDGHSTALIARLQQSHSELQATLDARDEQRLAHWDERLEAVEQRLGEHWQRGAEQIQQQQREICQTLAHTAQQTSAQSQAQAQSTLEQIGKLVQSASEAPRAAAEVIAELRQTLSESMVRDTAMLEERSRLLATLQTLLDAVNHASTEQRSAIDALVTTSADLLERVGSRFSVQLDAETGKLGAVAAQVNGSAIEVASLGQTLGVAVELFGQSNQALMERLQAVAEGLDKSLLRSDEQLAYYVAQAREVVDLSMLSQKQIIAELQQLAGRAPAAATAGA